MSVNNYVRYHMRVLQTTIFSSMTLDYKLQGWIPLQKYIREAKRMMYWIKCIIS